MKKNNEPDKVWVEVTHKMNLGNYESIDVKLGASATVLSNETRDDKFKELEVEAAEHLVGYCKAVRRIVAEMDDDE